MGNSTFVACAFLSVGTAMASADLVSIYGDASTSLEGTGAAFSGMLDYAYDSGNMGTLTVSLFNDSDNSVGGFLTGFVFNIDSTDALASATLSSASNTNFLDTGTEMASPFGMFDAGAALGANWNGGGNPSMGLGIGASGTFVFSITASDADMLGAGSFLGASGEDFAVRFRGLSDGGSDKLLVTPAPGTASVALLGLALATRRRR